MADVGKIIAETRKKRGLTQEELASRVGYKTKSAINKIELGNRDLPQKKSAAFAEALGVTPAYLMGWEEVQKKNDTLSDIVIRLRTDKDFFSVVEELDKLDSDKLNAVRQLLAALL